MVLENLKIDYPKIEIVPVDLCEWETATEIIKTILPIDLLVNNAGIGYIEPLITVTEEQYDRYILILKKKKIIFKFLECFP